MENVFMVNHPYDNSHYFFDDKEDAINFAFGAMESYYYEDGKSADIYICERIDEKTINLKNKKFIGSVCYTEPELDFFETVV